LKRLTDCNTETGIGHEAQALEIIIIIIISSSSSSSESPPPCPAHNVSAKMTNTTNYKLSSNVICCLQLSVTCNQNCAIKIRTAVCWCVMCARVICTVAAKEKSKHHRLHGFV